MLSFLFSKLPVNTKRTISIILILLVFIVGLAPLQSCVYFRTELEAEYRKQADALFMEGKYEESLEYYKKAKRITFSNNARYRIAEIQIRLKNFEESRKQINILLRRDRKNVLVKELDAYWHFSSGDIDTALEKYLDLETRTPYNARVLSNIGIIYQTKGNSLLAIEYFNTVLNIQALTPLILESYMNAITSINAQTDFIEKQQEQSDIYLSMIVKRYIESYKSDEITIEELYEIALILKEYFVEYTYPVFSVIADTSINEKIVSEQALIAQANLDIVHLILNKEYVPLDVDSLQLILSYLEVAIDSGLGTTRSDTEMLKELTTKASTVVLKRRMYQLYFEKEIISKVEYDKILEELSAVQTETSEQITSDEIDVNSATTEKSDP